MRPAVPRGRLAAVLGVLALADCSDPEPPVAAAAGGIPPPSPDDPVAEWEVRYLPAIDQHMQAGRLDSVIHVCQLGLREDTTRIVLYNLLASAYAAQGRYDDATATLETAVRLSPGFVTGWVNLGGIQSRQGLAAAAIPYLEEAARLDTAAPAGHRRLGEVYLRAGRHEQAEGRLRAALAILPHDATLTFLLGEALQGLGRTDEALTAFRRAGDLDPGLGETHLRAAELARAGGRTSLADSLLSAHGRLLQIAGGDSAALATMVQLRGALANAPEEAIHQARLGGFFLFHGYLPEALALFDRAAALEPDNAWLLNEFGGLLSQRGHGPQALRFYRLALEAQPDLGPALLNTGGILNAMQRPEEALPYMLRAQEVSPTDPAVRFYLGVTYMSLGRRAEAERVLTEAQGLLGDGNAALREQVEAALGSLTDDAGR